MVYGFLSPRIRKSCYKCSRKASQKRIGGNSQQDVILGAGFTTKANMIVDIARRRWFFIEHTEFHPEPLQS